MQSRPDLLCRMCVVVGMFAFFAANAPATVPTTSADFAGPGTQPGELSTGILDSQICASCHANYDQQHEPFTRWAASMMGQAARDPVFWAAVAVAEQDAAFSSELCIRCHTPGGFLEGHVSPSDGSSLTPVDRQGISCQVCHRMVDPVYKPGVSPAIDQGVLNLLSNPPSGVDDLHNAHLVVDHLDRRRGPFDLGVFFFHEWAQAPFSSESALCGTCHDVSNPAFTRQPDNTYVLNAHDTPHTGSKYEQFPIERAYSEWLMSAFAQGPVEMFGRFGGNKTAVSSCQDCHMPDGSGYGATPMLATFRDDLPKHDFNGANSWVLRAVHALNDPDDTFLTNQSVDDSIARNISMLARAADLEATQTGTQLAVRVTNMSGHKLPTGYPEGRRMWLNIKFFDSAGAPLAEHGTYANDTLANDTTIYEIKPGVDADIASATGIPEGPSFHFAVNNMVYFDNRIPPMGFANADFVAIQSEPVGHTYADGQHWDDTPYIIPAGATRAEVRLFHQTTTREYIEFLRDTALDGSGQVAYDQWVLHGRSAPVEMALIDLTLSCPADINADGVLNLADVTAFIDAFIAGTPQADINADGLINIADVTAFIDAFIAGCP